MAPNENGTFNQLPLLPEQLLRQHHVHDPADTRFRSCARLLQSLWRQAQGLPVGTYRTQSGTRRKLGSRIAPAAAQAGRNFLTPAIAAMTRREVAYREIGALIHEHRLYGNLLSSMPLTFNLFGPLRLDLRLATDVVQLLFPDLRDASVRGIWFEHSPGRGSPTLTACFSSWDVFLTYERPSGRRGFIGGEVKYTEAMQEPTPELKPRYSEIAEQSGLFIDPASPALRTNPLQQIWREHLLGQAMLTRGDYDEGRFMFIAPRLNHLAQNAAGAYRCQLVEPTDKHVSFASIALEKVVEAIGRAGAPDYARELYFRYLDWHAVDQALDAALSVADVSRKRSEEVAKRPALKLIAPPAA